MVYVMVYIALDKAFFFSSTRKYYIGTSFIRRFIISIAPDKRGYLHTIFLISAQKHILWVLISTTEYPYHIFSCRNKKNIGTFRMKKAPYLELLDDF